MQGYRAFALYARKWEGLIRCKVHYHYTEKLRAAGMPLDFFWPVLGDWAGAKRLIDAIHAGDADAIRAMQREHPERSFGLGDYLARLDKARGFGPARRTVLRRRPLASGAELVAELVEPAGRPRFIRAAIMKNGRDLAAEVLAVDNDQGGNDG